MTEHLLNKVYKNNNNIVAIVLQSVYMKEMVERKAVADAFCKYCDKHRGEFLTKRKYSFITVSFFTVPIFLLLCFCLTLSAPNCLK